MDKVRIIFVLPSGCADESQASNIMIQAYESCKQLVANVSWVKEDDYERIDLNKTDFLIFQDFKGKNFEHLKASKCARILGPWCVSICLMEGRPIPNFPWPIYNVAMDGCTVSCSHLPKKVKIEIKEKVLLMGGCYTETLMSSNTHLITDSVGTEKYALAAERGLKLMTSDWVDAVWNASQEANVKANDEQFNQYKCKPFHKLVICITGFPYKDRQVLSKHIAENGGTFTAKLNLVTTNFLVCEGTAGSTSDKYKAARNTPTIQCVSAQWVYDSIEKGYALPSNLYPVKKSTSTPTKDDTLNPDFSMMSAIACSSRNENRTTLEETNLSTVSNIVSTPTKPTAKRKAHFEDEHITALEMLDMKAKMAGQYLDGCSVYIAGFNFEQREKLCKVLNLSGATRYDDISDRISHVIIGDPSCHDLRMIKARGYACALVSVGWLLESMELQQPANEQKFLVNPDLDRSEIGSPLSKKGLSLLRTSRMVREMDIDSTPRAEKEPEEVDNVGNEILDLYLNPNQGTEQDTLAQLLKNADTNLDSRKEEPKETLVAPNETTSQPMSTCTADYEDESQPLDIFNGFSFVIVGFDEEHALSLTEMIECSGGKVMSPSSKSTPNYGVVPVFNTAEVKVKASEIVNNLYVTECLQEGERQEIAYYHRPYVLKDTSPLEGCVITISGYSSFERSFLNNLIRELGGDAQDQFARKTATQKNIKACTHLVSLEANGKKYTAALKWGLPVVDKNWLLECANTGRMVPEQGYLVGESKAPEVNENLPPNSMSKVHASVSGIINDNTTLDQRPSTSKAPPPPVAAAAHIDLTREDSTPDKTLRAHTSTSVEANENVISDPHHSSSRSIVQVSDKSDENSKPSSSAGISKASTFVKPTAVFHTPPPQTASGRAQGGEKPGSPDPCSQVTPVNKIMEEVRMSSLLGTPQTPPMPRAWGDFDTPETPLGAFIRPNPSPRLRKEMLRYLNQFPDFEPPRQRRQSTPMSELKRRLWDKVLKGLCGDSFTVDDETRQEAESQVPNRSVSEDNENGENIHTTPPLDSVFNDSFGLKPLPPSNKETPENKLVQSKIMQLENLLTASTEKKRCSRNFQTSVPAQVVNPEMKDSQAFTVGWDYMPDTIENSPTRIFMISGVDSDTRQLLVPQIEQLGGIVSDLPNYDSSCTHLICPKPARNEKTLACMAAGKWILHISYIEKSVKSGKFLSEEEFEFGNEKSVQNISLTCDRDTEIRISASYWWRKEISRRGYGAFNDMRAIVVANKREPIIRVIEAGGGSVVNIEPPFDGSVHATHCLLEARSVPDYSVYFPLAEQGVYCVNTLYISEFLHRTSKDIRDCVLPYFVRYYK